MLTTYIYYWFGIVFLISTFFIIGHSLLLLFQAQPNRPYLVVFLKLVSGLLVSVIGTALFFTQFQTILLGLLIPIGALVVDFYKNKNSFPPQTLPKVSLNKQIGVLLEGILVITLVYSIAFYQYATADFSQVIHIDDSFRSKIAYFMAQFGRENIYMDVIYPADFSVSPYHYFELWLTTLAYMIFGGNIVFCHTLIANKLLLVVVYWGLGSILETFLNSNWQIKVWAFSGLLFGGFFPEIYKSIPFILQANTFMVNALHEKLLIIYIILILGILAACYKRHYWIFLSLLILPFVYISTAPGVFSGIFGFLVIYYWFDKDRDLKLMGQTGLMMIISAVFLAGFYLFLAKSSSSESILTMLFTKLLSYEVIKTAINIFIGTNIHIFILNFPTILILANYQTFKLVKQTPFISLAIVLYVCLLLSWAGFNFITDAVQLFSNLGIPMLNLLFFITIVYQLSKISQPYQIYDYFRYTLFALILGMTYWQTFIEETQPIHRRQSTDYLTQIGSEIKNIANPIGAYMKAEKEYKTIFSKSHMVDIKGYNLAMFNPQYHLISLSIFDTPLDKKSRYYAIEKSMQETSPFFKFVQNQRKNNKFVTIEQSQIDFLEQFKIKYLILSPFAEPSNLLKQQIKKEIKDPVSGERCLLLN